MSTNPADNPNPRDVRLAAAFTIHHRSGDKEGMAEIVRDTSETGRASELLLSVLDLHKVFIVQSRTPTGIDYLGRYVQDLGKVKPDDPKMIDLRRACRILDGHGRDDLSAINDVIREARDDNRCTHALMALMGLYETAVPELSSTAGRKWLDACVTTTLGQEDS
ncbi:MAG TPA: hypothetical protein PLI79_20660 [Mycobacterium sp.]|nr:hypothetical protein [Mycobacterium sp.]